MSEKRTIRRITQQADEIIARVGVIGNPYLTALKTGKMSLDCFRRTQEQFFYAVTFYPRPMAALIARLTDPKSRLDILHNLVEEHGEFQARAFHHSTFRRFLRTLGSPLKNLDGLFLWPEIRAFNCVLITACVHDEVEVGAACMGVIEYAFADISSVIASSIVGKGWIPKERLVHYSLHAKIDKRHAQDFFSVVAGAWENPARRYFVEQGLELGVYIFDRLYRDLYASGLHPERTSTRNLSAESRP